MAVTQGGTQFFFRIHRLGPSFYRSPQKNIRNFKQIAKGGNNVKGVYCFHMGLAMRISDLICCMGTTQVQTTLCIRAVCSSHLFFTYWKVSCLNSIKITWKLLLSLLVFVAQQARLRLHVKAHVCNVYGYGFLFNCTTMGQASDSMHSPR